MKKKIYYSKSDPWLLNLKFIEDLFKNCKSGSRIILHDSNNNKIHQMVIMHTINNYIVPHINNKSSKSFNLLKGKMYFIWFDIQGNFKGKILLNSKNNFVRFNSNLYHTLVPISSKVYFIETILGPHLKTKYAKWAPKSLEEIKLFNEKIKKFIRSKSKLNYNNLY